MSTHLPEWHMQCCIPLISHRNIVPAFLPAHYMIQMLIATKNSSLNSSLYIERERDGKKFGTKKRKEKSVISYRIIQSNQNVLGKNLTRKRMLH